MSKHRRVWILRSSDGKIYTVTNLSRFLRDSADAFPNFSSAMARFSLLGKSDAEYRSEHFVNGWQLLPDLVGDVPPQSAGKEWKCYKALTCRACGREYYGHIKTIRCPECQAEADARHNAEYRQRRAAGHNREIWSIDLCERCGAEYIVNSGLQRYCKDCAEEATRQTRNDASREWNHKAYSDPDKRAKKNENKRAKQKLFICAVCGHPFFALGRQKYCSDECRLIGFRQYQQKRSKERWQKIKAERQKDKEPT